MHYVMSPELKLLLKQYLALSVFNTTSLYLSTWFFFISAFSSIKCRGKLECWQIEHYKKPVCPQQSMNRERGKQEDTYKVFTC